ncbi:molybdenum cofactor guanylyltransferase [Flavobacterium sp. LB3P45]|uniref:Molybdenum cofactor guanylyltransferase n=1 Tax=Flavobacterium fructosi TaxID=3230416 RepID=A0ABW6HQ64_9FLAO
MQVSILCGGKSSPMQLEKGLVLYQNKPFIAHIIEAVLPISSNIQLITNTNDYDYLPYNKVKDIVVHKGPLGGIYTALVHSETEMNLILSCEIPLISSEILLELIENHGTNFEVSVFKDTDWIHPLIGIYATTILPVLKKAIDANDLKMMRLISNVKHQLIPIPNAKRHLFKNINSVAELNELNTNLS